MFLFLLSGIFTELSYANRTHGDGDDQFQGSNLNTGIPKRTRNGHTDNDFSAVYHVFRFSHKFDVAIGVGKSDGARKSRYAYRCTGCTLLTASTKSYK